MSLKGPLFVLTLLLAVQFCQQRQPPSSLIKDITYWNVNASSNYPIQTTVMYNDSRCNAFDEPLKVFFPIPFLLGGAQCWHVEDLLESDFVVSAPYPKIQKDQVSGEFYWVLEAEGVHQSENTTERIVAAFSYNAPPMSKVSVVAFQTFRDVASYFSGTLITSDGEAQESDQVVGVYNGFDLTPFYYTLVVEHIGADGC